MVEFCHRIGQIYLLDLWGPCVFVHAFLIVASGQVLYVSRAKYIPSVFGISLCTDLLLSEIKIAGLPQV